MGLLLALLGAVLLGVLTRAANDPVIWSDELSRILMVWLACIGWILAGRKRIHIRIRYVQDRLPAPLRRGGEVAIQAAITLLGLLLTGYGALLVERNHDLEATTLPLSMAWLYVPMVLAGLATALQGAAEMAEALRHGPDRGRETPLPAGSPAE
nr:TRAP transporter small permease subunit [Roseomonas sp. GC11]